MNRLFGDFRRCLRVLPASLRWRAGGLLGLMVVSGLMELAFILSLTWMTGALTSPESFRQKFCIVWLFTLFPALADFGADPRKLALLSGVLVIGASSAKSLFSWLAASRTVTLSDDISVHIGRAIMTRFLYSDYLWHLSKESAATYNCMTSRARLGAFLLNLLQMYSACITMLLLFSYFVGSEPILSLFVVCTTVLIGIWIYRLLRSQVESNGKAIVAASAKENQSLHCALKGIREILLFRQQTAFLDSVFSATDEGKHPRQFNALAPRIPKWILEAVGFVMVVLSIAYLVFVENADIVRIRTALTMLVLTAWRVLPYSNQVVGHQVQLRGIRHAALAVLGKLEELERQPPRLPAPPAPGFRFADRLELRAVSFRYPGARSDSLRQINLTVKKGQKIGLVGASGAGKSTLAGVLAKLLQPSGGDYLVDGHALNPAELSAFMASIGYVPQRAFLFKGSVAENIAFSQWGKPWDKARVLAAARQAAVDFITPDTKGLAYRINDDGAGLSGGQIQRLNIARALYSEPSILFFDEATSALDQGNENIIMDTIRNLPGKVTTFIIAHRLTTVEECDQIVWLEQGQIRQVGPPSEILPLYTASMQ